MTGRLGRDRRGLVGLGRLHRLVGVDQPGALLFGGRPDVVLCMTGPPIVANIARYHRQGLPQKAHPLYTRLHRADRVRVNKLAAILRLANALDAEHLQKIRDVRVHEDEGGWTLDVEGVGDLTMERLAATARADMLTDVFGKRVVIRGSGAGS